MSRLPLTILADFDDDAAMLTGDFHDGEVTRTLNLRIDGASRGVVSLY